MATSTNTIESLSASEWLDSITRENGHGSMSQTMIELLAGINIRGFGSMAPHNNDNTGIILFTRPRFNLSYDNLGASRVLTPLMSSRKDTYQAYIRDALDPEGVALGRWKNCPFFDSRSAFIPLLGNTCLSSAGWPDKVLGTFTSNPGVYQEEYSLPDGPVKIYNTWSMTANFRNIAGDPVSALFAVMYEYIGLVKEGVILPHIDSLVENECDYNMAVWRLVLNYDRTKVQKISRTIAFPTTVPTGAAFNFDSNTGRVSDNDEISINFQCMGAEYNDPILISEFNHLVELHNPNMAANKRTSTHVKLGKDDFAYFNWYAFPWINDDYTSENHNDLEWWVPKDIYTALQKKRKLA